MLIPCEVEIPMQRISDILCNAFEGGSNYWIDHVEFWLNGDHVTVAQARKALAGKTNFDASMTSDAMDDPAYLWLPLVEGGELRIKVSDEGDKNSKKLLFLDKQRIETGLKVMATMYRKHFNDIVDENDDAITGDVLLQCCVFGETIYG
jgi:hypothetical protein